MKRIIPIFLAFLLSGCMQQPIETTTPETSVPETTAPSTQPPTDAPDPLNSVLSLMTTEEKVGQMFLARCPRTDAVEAIEKYHLGGYILFARDFEGETPVSLREKLQSYQSAANTPMLFAVDEEGGTVNRISCYKAFRESPFLSPRRLYNTGGMDLVLQTENEKAALLASIGINVNVGPVCDVTTEPAAFMFPRSLGQSPQITGEFIKNAVKIMGKHNIGSILKHFPGYGDNTDTHFGIAVDERSIAALESIDLVPFASGIEAGCGAIMVSHVYINAIDESLPATLSPAVHDYLRQNMGFGGVIVTDDLVMQAITNTYGAGEAAVLAILAGNDLLCSTDYETQYDAVLQAVKEDRISEDQLNESVLRLLRWKAKLGLM